MFICEFPQNKTILSYALKGIFFMDSFEVWRKSVLAVVYI